jgi:hypothetical protein
LFGASHEGLPAGEYTVSYDYSSDTDRMKFFLTAKQHVCVVFSQGI